MSGGGNVYSQSATGMQAAGQGAQAAMAYQPQMVGTTPQGTTLARDRLSAYQNPYTQSVVDTSLGDLDRARQMAVNDTGAAASAAGAFGGSRHGVAESLTNRGFAEQAATMASGLRHQGFQTALGAAQHESDGVNNMVQFNAGQKLQAGLANQGAGLAGAAQRLQGASALGGLAQTGFGMGQDIQATQAGYGAQQQANNQNLFNAATGQWEGFAGYPSASTSGLAGVLGSVPYSQSQTTQQKRGLFDWASLLIGGM